MVHPEIRITHYFGPLNLKSIEVVSGFVHHPSFWSFRVKSLLNKDKMTKIPQLNKQWAKII